MNVVASQNLMAFAVLSVSLLLLWHAIKQISNVFVARRRKLSTIKSGASSRGSKPARMVFRQRASQTLLDQSARQKEEKIARLKDKLRAAGFDETETIDAFRFAKILSGASGFLISGVIFFILDPLNLGTLFNLSASAVFAGLAWLIPEKYVDWRAAARLQAIEQELSNVIDHLLLCVHSGLSLDESIRRIVAENTSTPLHEELAVISVQLTLSAERDAIYKKACERIRSKVFTSLMSSLLQAEQYGVSMSRALRSFSDELREERTLSAEAHAGKLPTQMTLVMMAFILPAFLVMVTYPLVVGLFTDVF